MTEPILCPKCGGGGKLCERCGKVKRWYVIHRKKMDRCGPVEHRWVTCPECGGAGLKPANRGAGAG